MKNTTKVPSYVTRRTFVNYSTLNIFTSWVERFTLAGRHAGSQDYLLPPSHRISKYAECLQLSSILTQNWAEVTIREGIQFLPERPSNLGLSVEKKRPSIVPKRVFIEISANRVISLASSP